MTNAPLPAARLQVSQARAGGATVLGLRGAVDSITAPTLEAQLDPHLTGGDAPRVLLDLSETNYISSAGLRLFVKSSQVALKRSGELAFCSPQKHVHEVLELAGLSSAFALFASREAYLARSIGGLADAVDDASLTALDRNKRAVLRFLMILQFCTYAEMPIVTDPEMVTRLAPSLTHGDAGNTLGGVAAFESHLRDLHSTQEIDIVIESMIAEGDMVATNNITRRHYRDGRFMATRYLSFYRLHNERIVEKIDVYDRLDEQQQLARNSSRLS